jgi:hypothetical protein
MRFNVTVCHDPRVLRWLERIAMGKGPDVVGEARSRARRDGKST